MIKITDIEALLDLPYEAEIEINGLTVSEVIEVSRLFNSIVDVGCYGSSWTEVKKNKVLVRLRTPSTRTEPTGPKSILTI